MSKQKLPKVSFVIPTLNEELRLPKCLTSVLSQNYPKELIEIAIADGGSTDKTVSIAKDFGATVFYNKSKTSESGKALGVKNATGAIICFIDADNILPDNNWLKMMTTPLIENTEIIGAEALYFTYRKQDGFIDRYCALIGMNDPLCLWLGSYDRMNYLTQKWTGLAVTYKRVSDYLEITLESGKIPTIGANGSMIRKVVFDTHPELFGEYLFDTDILEQIVAIEGPQKYAKVDVGIIHLYCGSNIKWFAKKQLRRVKDYLYRRHVWDIFVTQKFEERKYAYGHKNSISFTGAILKFVLYCVLVVPLVYQSVLGYSRKNDLAWFAHPLLCWITLMMYAYGTVLSFVKNSELSRNNWSRK